MIIITDTAITDRFPKTIGGYQVEVQALGDFRRKPNILVIDIDLLDPDNVRRLRSLLKDAPDVVAVSVDQASHHARTQAYALGATTLLPHPLRADDLEMLVARETLAFEADKDSLASVDCAVNSLADSFVALETDGSLNMPQIRESSEDIVTAVAERGLGRWLDTVRALHKSTFQHCLIVTAIATSFGHSTGMSRKDVALLTTTGLLHDIGKVRIPLEILDKPGKLTADEMAVVRRHSTVGYEYLRRQGGIPKSVLSAVLHHHEYLDGSGYPDGLKDAEIDDLTRILTVCDTYGALIELRPYKPPRPPEEAIGVLEDMVRAGKLEAALVRALAGMVRADWTKSAGRTATATVPEDRRMTA